MSKDLWQRHSRMLAAEDQPPRGSMPALRERLAAACAFGTGEAPTVVIPTRQAHRAPTRRSRKTITREPAGPFFSMHVELDVG
jgi:hypothetical protein